ncbi:MAG: branched-chain amino acid ABC transporter substrate-binding protein [Ardenticatenia bacterium]|nr:MAG: branched-chain amino acid ABC transporter substrate-binding protein [Ardenticatenia bacterium]
MKKWFVTLLVSALVLALLPVWAFAAPPAQIPEDKIEGKIYTLEPRETLSLVAAREFGNVLAFPAIVYFNNFAARKNPQLTLITDPNAVKQGDVILIPTADLVKAYLAGERIGPAKGDAPPDDPWGVVTVGPGEPVRIGFAAALSGAGVDVLGIDEKRGAELAVVDRPTLAGHPVELVVEDDLCSGEGGTAVANKFVADPTIVAVVGNMCSSSSIPASDIYERAGYTMVSPSSTAVAFTARGLRSANRVCWSDAIQGPAAAKFVYEKLGLRKVATIHDGSPYGEGLVNAFAEAFKAMGGEVVAQEAVSVGDTDMRPVLTKIGVNKPELIYFGGFVAEGAFLASQRADVGMENVIFMGADGIKAEDFIKSAGAAAEGVYASAADLATAGPGVNAFLAKYEATYGEKPPAPFHLHAYDAVNVIMDAIYHSAVQGPDGTLWIGREALNRAVRATTGYQGLSGVITCQPNGDCGTGTVAMSKVVNGQWVPAE